MRELIGKGAAGYIVKTTPKSELLEKIEKIIKESGKRQIVREILILDNDVAHLKMMRDVLIANNYKVKTVLNTMEAVDHIRNHHPNLFIIGADSSGEQPQAVYRSLEKIIRDERVIPLVMEETFFTPELVDRVSEALS